jgi:hypothetical protein
MFSLDCQSGSPFCFRRFAKVPLRPMESSRLFSPATSTQTDHHPHVERLLIIPSPSHVKNSTLRDRFAVPRKPVRGYSSVARGEQVNEFTVPMNPVGRPSSVAVDEQVYRSVVPRKPVGGYSSVSPNDSDELVGEGGTDSIPWNQQRSLSWRPSISGGAS